LQASGAAPTGVFPVTIVESRRRDIEGFEVTVPRGISSPTGDSVPHALRNATITITPPAGAALFPDSNLDTAIRNALGFNPGATIEASELATLTTLTASNRGITNLSGLEFATNLTLLDLSQNSVQRVDVLSGLSNLTTLDLGENLITDAGPLRTLVNLTALYLDFNGISDLSPLSTLTQLTTLTLTGNLVSTLSPLAGLTTLRDLRLDDNFISNVLALQGLINLNTLMLDSNLLADIAPLAANTGLATGDLVTLERTLLDEDDCSAILTLTSRGATVTYTVPYGVTMSCGGDLIPDPGLEAAVRAALNKPTGAITSADLLSLTSLDASGRQIVDLTGLEYAQNLVTLDAQTNQISDLSPLSGLSSLRYLYLDVNRIIDLNPLSDLVSLQWLLVQSNDITNITPLRNLSGLSLLYLTNNKVRDISPLANLSIAYLSLNGNRVTDISALKTLGSIQQLYIAANIIGDILPLVQNAGLGSGDTLDVRSNPLDGFAVCEDLATLRNRGVTVTDDGRTCSSLKDRFEPNAGYQNAVEILPGQLLSNLSLISTTGTYKPDWFKFTLARPAEVSLEAAGSSIERNPLGLALALYRMADLQSQGTNAVPIDSAGDVLIRSLGADTYVLLVEEMNFGRVGNYAMSVGVDYFESNAGDDTAGRATPIAIPGFNNTGVTSYAGPGGAIADLTTQQFTLNVPAGPTNQKIRDVNVHLGITHTFDSNLQISLRSPAGTLIVLVANRGSSGDNFTGTILDDEAAAAIGAGTAPFSGAYRPENALSAFDNQSPGGNWVLTIADQVTLNLGTLNSWSLEFELDGDAGASVGHTLTPIYSTRRVAGSVGPIPDVTTSQFSAVVPAEAGSSKLIADVDLALDLTHTYDGDLITSLSAAGGPSQTLINQIGGGGYNFTQTLLDDEADTAITGATAPFTGRFRPQNPLSVFDGLSPYRNWTLTVQDAVGGDFGNLNNWSLLLTLKDPEYSEDSDWFSFTLQQTRHIRVRAITRFGQSKVELFGPASSTQPVPVTYAGDDNTAHYIGRGAGQYYLRVTPMPTFATWNYRFKVPSYDLLIEDEAAPDRFEDDDVSARATELLPGPSPQGNIAIRQTHNFHDQGDVDWLRFIAPRRDQHPVIQITDLGSRAFPVVEVYAADAATLLGTANGSITIDFNTQDNEPFYIRIRNADPSVFGFDTTYGASTSNPGGSLTGTISGRLFRDGQIITGAANLLLIEVMNTTFKARILASGSYFIEGVPLSDVPYSMRITTECGQVATSDPNGTPYQILVTSAGITAVGSNSLDGLIAGDLVVPLVCPLPGKIYVDFGAAVNGNGSPALPFNSLHAGVTAAIPGNDIYIKGSSATDTFGPGALNPAISKRLQLLRNSTSGAPRIGAP
jgi:internalin A